MAAPYCSTLFTDAISCINKLKPQNECRNDGKYASLNLPKGNRYGLIAQELEEVLPDLVIESKHEIGNIRLKEIRLPSADKKVLTADLKEKEAEQKESKESINIKAVNYTELIPATIKAMQELDKKQKKGSLKKEIDELKAVVQP